MSKENVQTPFIAIIGKPNVGKSSLFNRLVKRRIAITSDIAGTTRDRLFYHTDFDGKPAVLVDTSGLEFKEDKKTLDLAMHDQVEQALHEADLIVYLVDGQSVPTNEDHETANVIRRSSKEVLLVANKCDNKENTDYIANWSELGLGAPQPISVIHNLGIAQLVRNITKKLPSTKPIKRSKHKSVKLSFVGRPNAGKSTMINAILNQDRVITSDVPGTTRDSVDVEFEYDGQKYTLIDTAGIRRRGKIEKGIEKYSLFRSFKSIERSDIVCLILDYSVGIRAQDLHISEFITEASKGLILIINKIDLMEDKEADKKRIISILKRRFDFLSWAPVIFTSAIHKKNVAQIFELAKSIEFERNRHIDHDILVDFLRDTFHKHYPATVGRKKALFYDMKQLATQPPKFEITCNNNEIIHFSYQRYIENQFREKFGFTGTCIDFIYKNLDRKSIKKTQPL